MFVVPSLLVCTVDVDGKLDGPAVTVEFPRQTVLNHATPAFREFLLNHPSPADDRHHVGVVVCLKQRQTLAIVEFAVKVDGLDTEVKAVKDAKKLCEDAAGGVAVGKTAHRQCVAFVLHTRVECGVGVERGGSTLRLGVIEAVGVVFVAIVGPQVEVRNDLHLLGKDVKNVFLEERVTNLFERLKVELGAEMVEDRVSVGCIFAFLTERRDRGPVGARADEDLVDVFSIEFGVFSECESNFLVKRVDEEVKELVLVDFIVCLLLVLDTSSASRRLN